MTWETKIPKFRRFVLQNFPFIEEDFDALTDYQLISKVVEYLNNVINSQNQLISEVENFETNITSDFNRLENLFIELKSYVDNYFDNLDVQEEINNKLDDMVEQGTLQEIIADYLNSKAVFGFDTVADMKLSTNLIDGSYAETLGYYNRNDGGSALYKVREITNDDVVDESTIISLYGDDLVGELVFENQISTRQLGCKINNTDDDTSKIQHGLDLLKARGGGVLIFNDGEYKVDELDVVGFSGNVTNNITLLSPNKYGAKLNGSGTSILRITTDGEGIIIDGLFLNGDTTNIGIRSNTSVANSIFRNIKIENVVDGINITHSHWLLTFSDIVIKPSHDGLHIHTEGTSSDLRNIYVYGGSGVGYYLGGAYSRAGNLACDSFTGIPYQFNYGIWTIDSIGCENPSGVNIIKLEDYCNVSIGNVYLRGVTNSTEYIINERGHNNLNIGTLRMNSNSATNLDTQLMTFGNGYDVVQIDKINTLNTTFKADAIEYFSRAGKCTAIIESEVYRLGSAGNAQTPKTWVFNDNESIDYYYGADKASIIWCKDNPKTINGMDSSWYPVGKEGKVMLKSDFSKNKGVLGYVKINSNTENYRDITNFGKIPLILLDETANRPTTDLVAGQCMFDSTLGKPIWYTGSGWVDATGTTV